MQMHLHYMHILSILLDVQAQKKEPQRDSNILFKNRIAHAI